MTEYVKLSQEGNGPMNLDQLIAKLRASLPADSPNAAFCRPQRVDVTLENIAQLERLQAQDAGLRAVLKMFAIEPEGKEQQS